MKIVATEQIVFESPDPRNIYCFSPGILRLADGKLIATFDLGGPGVKELPGAKSASGDFGMANQCKVFLSNDHGKSWRHTADLPMLQARPFTAGNSIYLLGRSRGILICRSDDGGETWSDVSVLDNSTQWNQAPSAIDYRHGNIYLTMEQITSPDDFPASAPVLMRARESDNLLERKSWSFSNPLFFPEKILQRNAVGVPFYPSGCLAPGPTTPDGADKRFCGNPGWMETHVVRIYDPRHNFYDPEDRTVFLWMRAHTGMANLAAIARGREMPDGSLSLELVHAPRTGAEMIYVPMPGGQMKFHILYDEATCLYWLVSTQTTDSMTRPDLLPNDRFGLPDNERHRLQLHFSKNLFDWCFAGMIAIGDTPRQARHYASMTIDGEDLCILSRSGDHRARDAHNGNLITLHRVKQFRNLVY